MNEMADTAFHNDECAVSDTACVRSRGTAVRIGVTRERKHAGEFADQEVRPRIPRHRRVRAEEDDTTRVELVLQHIKLLPRDSVS